MGRAGKRANVKKATINLKPDALASISDAFATLGGAAAMLRERLAAIDALEHPTRWAGVNDQIRAIEERLTGLRDEQQRVALARAELRVLGESELAVLREATTRLAQLVQAAATVSAVAEAAGGLVAATSAAITRLRG
jgi:hypothetical protein